jgi:50S ribosomal protein L16 3-hydroxylase
MALTDWLTMPAAELLESHFGKVPFAQPGAGQGAAALLTWQTVADLLRRAPPPDMLVTRAGRLLDAAPPSSAEELEALLAGGGSLVVRKVERHHEALSRLADDFARELGGAATIHIFATPQRLHTFGWHYDCEDVFIIQTAGQKEYLLRQNTVNPHPTVASMPKDLQFERETSPLAACTLLPGDWLYIPSGWWHVARPVERSLSLSVGVLTPYAAGRSTAP